MNILERMSNSAQRTSTSSILDFNVQQRLNNQRCATTIDDDDIRKIKVNKFDLYYEDRMTLKDWFTQIKIYLLFNSVEKNRKTLFVFTFLRGRAERWLKPSLRKKLNDNEDNKEIFAQFSEFKKKIRRIFEVFNEKQTAERVIQHLIQKTSVSDYAARFQEHVNLIEWNDVALMIMFRRELKDNVKDEIMRDKRDYKSLAEFIEIVIDFDDKFYERAMKKRYDQFKDRAELIYESTAEYAKSKQQSYIKNSEYIELTSMELDMTH